MNHLMLIIILVLHTLSSFSEIIYGEDNRQELSQLNQPAPLDNSALVAVQIEKSNLALKTNGYYGLKNTSTYGQRKSLCPYERFSQQLALGKCSAFLVKDDVIATATHCLGNFSYGLPLDKCKKKAWIFNYAQTNTSDDLNIDQISKEEVYSCESLIYYSLPDKDDIALIKLDRAPDRKVLPRLGRVKKRSHLYSIGHPGGVSKKLVHDGSVFNRSERFFETNLDLFRGCSGSPVFDERNHELLGMVLEGRQDYTYDSHSKCYRVNTCSENGANCGRRKNESGLEKILRVEVIKELMRTLHL